MRRSALLRPFTAAILALVALVVVARAAHVHTETGISAPCAACTVSTPSVGAAARAVPLALPAMHATPAWTHGTTPARRDAPGARHGRAPPVPAAAAV